MRRKGIEYQLRRAIDSSALSRNQLSAKSGVDSTKLRLFIKGRKSLTLTAAENLAAALGLKFKVTRQTPWW
ncbi:MAG: helix-turn-helix domain-containing protein [Planctomycetota bacterium]|jgi:ribosome-binding protein aMBF1 (putative translation factor)